MAVDRLGIATGATARALIVLNPYRYGIQKQSGTSVLFDLIMDETRELTAEVTENPIQDGSTITDHIHFNLWNGSVRGLVSNFSKYAILSAPGALPSGLLQDRFKQVYAELERAFYAAEPVTVYCVSRKYEGVLLTGLSTMRSSDDGQSQIFDISFKQARIVNPVTGTVGVAVNAPGVTTSDGRQGSPLVNLGAT